VQLLDSKRGELREHYGVEFAFSGVASRRLGWHANPAGFSAADLIGEGTAFTSRGGEHKPQGAEDQTLAELREWLAASQANVLFENTSMNPHTGQPAIDYVRTALQAGIHVVTANKGPVVHAYRELRDLAAANHVRFLHEAAVMGGAPIFSLFREALPAARLERLRGILNSTTNLILTEMENGTNYEAAVKKAQDLGIAETDPSFDVDGWDATVKVSALATVLMDFPLKPNDITREGIRGLSMEKVQSTVQAGVPGRAQGRRHGGGQRAARAGAQRRAVGRLRWGDVNYSVPDGRDPRADTERDPPRRGDDGLRAAGRFHHDCQESSKPASPVCLTIPTG